MVDLPFGLIIVFVFVLVFALVTLFLRLPHLVSVIRSRSRRNNSLSSLDQKSWAEILSDEGNLWLEAIRAKERGNYLEAASAFINDALRVNRDSPLRKALSCYNAAASLDQIGLIHLAKQAYETAANFFMMHADKFNQRFPRESLWALNRACQCFYLAGNVEKAKEIASEIALIDSLLEGTPETSGKNLLEELEKLAGSSEKFKREQGVGFSVCGSHMVELTNENGKMSCLRDGNCTLDKFAEDLKAKLEELSAIFKQRVKE